VSSIFCNLPSSDLRCIHTIVQPYKPTLIRPVRACRWARRDLRNVGPGALLFRSNVDPSTRRTRHSDARYTVSISWATLAVMSLVGGRTAQASSLRWRAAMQCIAGNVIGMMRRVQCIHGGVAWHHPGTGLPSGDTEICRHAAVSHDKSPDTAISEHLRLNIIVILNAVWFLYRCPSAYVWPL